MNKPYPVIGLERKAAESAAGLKVYERRCASMRKEIDQMLEQVRKSRVTVLKSLLAQCKPRMINGAETYCLTEREIQVLIDEAEHDI